MANRGACDKKPWAVPGTSQPRLPEASPIPYHLGMSSALEQIDYTVVNGEKSEPLLTIFALSTCAFCKKAMNYLEEHGFGYRYCYLDDH